MSTPFITNRPARGRSPLQFFAWVFALSLPFWGIQAVTGGELWPRLPVSALQAVCPLMAASILMYQESKAQGVRELLQRPFDYRRIGVSVWYIPLLLLAPGLTVL